MTRKNNPDHSQAYSRIPRVDSPGDLDRRILAESRRLAPERQGFYLPGWMPITATVCMIGLAVFVAKPVIFNLKAPQRVNTSPVLQKQKEIPTIEAYKDDQALMDLDGSSDTAVEQVMENEFLSPETTSKVMPASDMAVADKNQVVESTESMSAAEIRLESQTKKISAEKKELPTEPVPGNEFTTPASAALEQDEVSMGLSATESMMAEPIANDQLLSEMELGEVLEDIRKLVEEGKPDAASARLEELRKQCPGCEIPNSLDEL